MRQQRAPHDNVGINKEFKKKYKQKEEYKKSIDSLRSGSTTEPDDEYLIGIRIVQDGKDLQSKKTVCNLTSVKFAASNFKNQPIFLTPPNFANEL